MYLVASDLCSTNGRICQFANFGGRFCEILASSQTAGRAHKLVILYELKERDVLWVWTTTLSHFMPLSASWYPCLSTPNGHIDIPGSVTRYFTVFSFPNEGILLTYKGSSCVRRQSTSLPSTRCKAYTRDAYCTLGLHIFCVIRERPEDHELSHPVPVPAKIV